MNPQVNTVMHGLEGQHLAHRNFFVIFLAFLRNVVRLHFILLLCFLGSTFHSQGAENAPTTLAQAAQEIAAEAEKKGLKKIAILTFSDLRNKSTTISKYFSDGFAAELLKAKHTFSVHLPEALGTNAVASGEQLRANLARIGVDAFVLATAVPLNDNVECSIKLIAVTSAEVITAPVCKISRSADINQVLELEGYMDWNQTFAELLRIRKGSEALGGLLINVESMKYSQQSATDVKLRMTVTFVNTNKTDSLSFAFRTFGSDWNDTVMHILSNRKDVYDLYSATGVKTMRYYDGGGTAGGFNDLGPLTSSHATLVFNLTQRVGDAPGDFPPYRFQAEVYIGHRTQEGVEDVKLHNFIFDLPAAK